jgi:hypothetical protein
MSVLDAGVSPTVVLFIALVLLTIGAAYTIFGPKPKSGESSFWKAVALCGLVGLIPIAALSIQEGRNARAAWKASRVNPGIMVVHADLSPPGDLGPHPHRGKIDVVGPTSSTAREAEGAVPDFEMDDPQPVAVIVEDQGPTMLSEYPGPPQNEPQLPATLGEYTAQDDQNPFGPPCCQPTNETTNSKAGSTTSPVPPPVFIPPPPPVFIPPPPM